MRSKESMLASTMALSIGRKLKFRSRLRIIVVAMDKTAKARMMIAGFKMYKVASKRGFLSVCISIHMQQTLHALPEKLITCCAV